MPSNTPAGKLRAFITRFAKRPDVRVVTSRLGEPAPADALAAVRDAIPSELFAFLSEMNGVHFEWAFVEPPGNGCIQIPALSAWTRFATDDELHTHFGADRRAMLLDVIQAECSTWYLLAEGHRPDEAVLWFTGSSGVDEGRLVARSLAEYIDRAIDHAFVAWWPAEEFPEVIARARAKPVKPVGLVPGTRVQSSEYSEGARGVVQEVRSVAADVSRHTEALGTAFARVALDEGVVGWIPTLLLKGVKRRDEYEDAVARGEAYWTELCARPVPERVAALARALGPLRGYAEDWGGPSNARRAAGMLSPLSLPVAVELIANAFADAGRVIKGGILLSEPRALEKSDREFDPSEWRAWKHEFVPAKMLEGLIAGLARRVKRASAERGEVPRALVPEAARLRYVAGFAQWLQPVLESERPIELPPVREVDVRDELGLPGPWGLALGSGY